MSSAIRNISLRTLRVFCVAAERESFREAAEASFLTSSAVSHQIKQLETELGVRLFERTPRSLKLTDVGHAFYDDLIPVIADLDSVAEKHAKSEQMPTLRISVQPFFASELFVPRLPRFIEEHPDIDISIDTSDEALQKHPGIADVSIRIFKTPPTSFSYDRLFPLRLTPAGSPDFYDGVKIKAGRIISDFPLVLHESRPKAWQEWVRSSRIGLPDPSNTIRLNSMIAVARAAERGLGAALIPRQLSEAWFESESLVQLFDHELQTKDAYYLVCRKDDCNNKEIQVFPGLGITEFRAPGVKYFQPRTKFFSFVPEAARHYCGPRRDRRCGSSFRH